MKGISPFPQSDPEVRENWRTTNDVVDELYFRRLYRPGMGHLTGTAAVTFVGATTGVSFPNAGVGSWYNAETRAARWQAAGVRFRVYYTCGVGSTNNFELAIVIVPHGSGTVLVGAATSLNTTLLLPGPAVANTEMVAELVLTTNTIIAGNLDLLSLRFRRDPAAAADVNGGDLLVTAITMEVLPQL